MQRSSDIDEIVALDHLLGRLRECAVEGFASGDSPHDVARCGRSMPVDQVAHERAGQRISAASRSIIPLEQLVHLVEARTRHERALAQDSREQLIRALFEDGSASEFLDRMLHVDCVTRLTENQLPVGSGVYIYQVEAPGAGKSFGRMVVFTEKERLNNY